MSEENKDRPMRSDMNKLFISGNLTKDVELCYTKSGKPVAHFRIASNDMYTDKEGERHENTVFIDVEAWAGTADSCAKFLSKGSRVVVQGKLKENVWEKDGETLRRIEISAESVTFCNGVKTDG